MYDKVEKNLNRLFMSLPQKGRSLTDQTPQCNSECIERYVEAMTDTYKIYANNEFLILSITAQSIIQKSGKIEYGLIGRSVQNIFIDKKAKTYAAISWIPVPDFKINLLADKIAATRESGKCTTTD